MEHINCPPCASRPHPAFLFMFPSRLAANPFACFQAYRDLARGEQAAAAMEANLTNLESKLDALLAAAEKSAEEAEAAKARESKAGDKDSAGEGRGSS